MNRTFSQKFYIRKWIIEKFAFNNTFWCQGASHLIQTECKTSNCLIQKLIFLCVLMQFLCVKFWTAKELFLQRDLSHCTKNEENRDETKILNRLRRSNFPWTFYCLKKSRKTSVASDRSTKIKTLVMFDVVTFRCNSDAMTWSETIAVLIKSSWSMNESRFYFLFLK